MAVTGHRQFRAHARRDILRRIAVTIGALLVLMAAWAIPIPYVPRSLIDSNSLSASRQVSVLAVGLFAWMQIYFFVQIVALVLPKSWAKRFTHDGYADPFSRTVLIGTIISATISGLGVLIGLLEIGQFDLEPRQEYIMLATLLGGTLAMIGIGTVIERLGTGGGFWIILAADMIYRVPQAVRNLFELGRTGVITVQTLLLVMVGIALVIGGGVILTKLRWRSGYRRGEPLIMPLFLAAPILWNIVGTFYGMFFHSALNLSYLVQLIALTTITALTAVRYTAIERSWSLLPATAGFLVLTQIVSTVDWEFVVLMPISGNALVLVSVVMMALIIGTRERMGFSNGA